jgi:hypothetical protein
MRLTHRQEVRIRFVLRGMQHETATPQSSRPRELQVTPA